MLAGSWQIKARRPHTLYDALPILGSANGLPLLIVDQD
jgi:hypothetical protein